MTRGDLAQQLLRWLNGALSPQELSEWAAHMMIENDNVRPRMPVGEHDFLDAILQECALSVEPQFVLTSERTQDFLKQLATEAEPSPGVLWK